MENKTATILVIAIVAAVIVTASGAYAMGRQTAGTGYAYPSSTSPGVGPSMMGGSGGDYGVMMEGHGMMGNCNGQSPMQQYMWHYWNTTSAP